MNLMPILITCMTLTGCSMLTPTVRVHNDAATAAPAHTAIATPQPVEMELDSDKQIRPMTRNEVIMAINECEANNTRAVVINARRKINGYSTEVVVDVTCAPKYRF